MKLELKHLASYLPYGLKCYAMGMVVKETMYDEKPKPTEFEIVGLTTSHVEIHEIGRTVTEQFVYSDCFPILRPLSQLTKEINHDNQCFTPIDTLDMNFLDFEYFHSNKGIDLSKVTYLDVVRLLSWHFDVFGLLEQGLAVELK